MPETIGYFDGVCEPANPGGTGAYGFVIGDTIEGRGTLPASRNMTNNVAEYRAALEAVNAWKASGGTGTFILRGDSKLVIEQMCGRWAVNGGAYMATRLALLEAVKGLDVRWEWVPREQNARADALSVAALASVGVKPRIWKKR